MDKEGGKKRLAKKEECEKLQGNLGIINSSGWLLGGATSRWRSPLRLF